MPRFSPAAALLLSVIATLLTSCRKPEIRVYIAPKDPPPSADRTADASPARPDRPKPKLIWTLPAGWRETAPGEVGLASFAIRTDAGEASANITPLPDLRGQEAMVVNMYRQQAGLAPLDQGELGNELKPVLVAGAEGQLLEVSGTNGGKSMRSLVAISHRDGRSWFYRLTGDDAVVAAQKPAFLDFLKSVRIDESAVAEEPSAAPAAPEFNWPVPAGWTPLAAGQMQVAKFAVPEREGAKAEVAVSIFPSDTGGTLANVNRWRKQLGLSEVDASGLPALVAPLDAATPDATLVSLTNESRALLGAIVPRGGQWWFYKLLGDSAAVTAERESFVSFAKAQP